MKTPGVSDPIPGPEFALAQLRHLYKMLLAGEVVEQAQVARGLLGPAIEELEKTPALKWEADHQRAALEAHGLMDLYYGCDSIERVCEALKASRAEIARWKEAEKEEAVIVAEMLRLSEEPPRPVPPAFAEALARLARLKVE